MFRPDVIAACHRADVPAMPGCFTPTEILAAWEAGADVVKVFPATVARARRSSRTCAAPMPQVRLMPTGGVTRENAGEWIRAGAVAIGVGTRAGGHGGGARRRFDDDHRERARHFVEAVRERARRPAPQAVAR